MNFTLTDWLNLALAAFAILLMLAAVVIIIVLIVALVRHKSGKIIYGLLATLFWMAAAISATICAGNFLNGNGTWVLYAVATILYAITTLIYTAMTRRIKDPEPASSV